MAPDAPGWLTITMVCPSAFSSSAAVTRVTWSVEPPAAQGTIRLIGRVGFHCAAALPAVAARRAATRTVWIEGLRLMVSPGLVASSELFRSGRVRQANRLVNWRRLGARRSGTQ